MHYLHPSNLPCNNNNGGMVDVFFSTLQIDGDPHIRLYQTKTILEFFMFNVCENASVTSMMQMLHLVILL
jgi:hypothetical protein